MNARPCNCARSRGASAARAARADGTLTERFSRVRCSRSCARSRSAHAARTLTQIHAASTFAQRFSGACCLHSRTRCRRSDRSPGQGIAHLSLLSTSLTAGPRGARSPERRPHERKARGGVQTRQVRRHLRGNGVYPYLLTFRARDDGRARRLYRDGVLLVGEITIIAIYLWTRARSGRRDHRDGMDRRCAAAALGRVGGSRGLGRGGGRLVTTGLLCRALARAGARALEAPNERRWHDRGHDQARLGRQTPHDRSLLGRYEWRHPVRTEAVRDCVKRARHHAQLERLSVVSGVGRSHVVSKSRYKTSQTHSAWHQWR
jgi:hypothetical protein